MKGLALKRNFMTESKKNEIIELIIESLKVNTDISDFYDEEGEYEGSFISMSVGKYYTEKAYKSLAIDIFNTIEYELENN